MRAYTSSHYPKPPPTTKTLPGLCSQPRGIAMVWCDEKGQHKTTRSFLLHIKRREIIQGSCIRDRTNALAVAECLDRQPHKVAEWLCAAPKLTEKVTFMGVKGARAPVPHLATPVSQSPNLATHEPSFTVVNNDRHCMTADMMTGRQRRPVCRQYRNIRYVRYFSR